MRIAFYFTFCLIILSCKNASLESKNVKIDDSKSINDSIIKKQPNVVLVKYAIYDSTANCCNREADVRLNYKDDKYLFVIKGKYHKESKDDSSNTTVVDSSFQIKNIQMFKILSENKKVEIKFQNTNETKSESFTVEDLRIRDYKDARLDSIIKEDIVFSDYNLDGFPDLSFYYDNGTGGYIYYTWIYRPSKNEYTIEPILSRYNNGEIDTINKTITTWWRNGIDLTEYYIYKIDGEKFIPLKKIIEFLETDSTGNSRYVEEEEKLDE
ncbi:MAG: hypothetical protein H6537_10550 [Bacteroidales bacterium]|nr:hypothetical protein [Bacteroidales bacterium]